MTLLESLKGLQLQLSGLLKQLLITATVSLLLLRARGPGTGAVFSI